MRFVRYVQDDLLLDLQSLFFRQAIECCQKVWYAVLTIRVSAPVACQAE